MVARNGVVLVNDAISDQRAGRRTSIRTRNQSHHQQQKDTPGVLLEPRRPARSVEDGRSFPPLPLVPPARSSLPLGLAPPPSLPLLRDNKAVLGERVSPSFLCLPAASAWGPPPFFGPRGRKTPIPQEGRSRIFSWTSVSRPLVTFGRSRCAQTNRRARFAPPYDPHRFLNTPQTLQ